MTRKSGSEALEIARTEGQRPLPAAIRRLHVVRAGAPPLGWRRWCPGDGKAAGGFVPIPHEATTRERIRELRDAGLSLRQICESLEQEGRATKRGGRWAPQTVARVLSRVHSR